MKGSLPSDYFADLSGIFKVMTVALANARRTANYDRDSNPVTGLVEKLGQLVMAMDDHNSAIKLAAFSKIVSLARDQVTAVACELEAKETSLGSAATKSARPVSQQQQPEGGTAAKETLDQVMQELRSHIGLSSVKDEVETLG